MSTANDVKSVLEELNFPLKDNANFESISLSEFSQILNWISKQLQFFAKTDSIVQVITGLMSLLDCLFFCLHLIHFTDDSDVDSLRMELNSLFREVDSIYTDSFTFENDRLNILHSLAGDLLAAQLSYVKNQNEEDFSTELNPRKDLSTVSSCLSIADDMKDTKTYFQKIKEKLQTNVLKFHEEDSLLLPNKMTLTPKQWTELKRLNEAFRSEYSIRREMILRRADTTINSFSWKEDPSRQVNQALLKDVYKKSREKMTTAPCITLANALAARSSDCNALISQVISTSHANCIIETPNVTGKANQGAQQQLQLHKFLIGSVPDRGGRPGEQSIPSKEIFSQQQGQRESANKRRGGGGGGGGGRGGGNYQRNSSPRGNDRNSNYQPRNIPEQTNRVQNAGWQQGGARGHNQNYRQYESYSNQYQGHQRFSTGYSNQNQYYPDYQQQNDYSQSRGGGRGGGGGYNQRY